MWLIFRIFINLWFKLQRALILPLYLLARRSFGLIVLAALGYVFYLFYSSDEGDTQRYGGSGSQEPGVVQPVRRHEDGNSAFASDLLTQMSEQELAYYSRSFYHVMEHQPAGKPHLWQFYNIHGQITPQAPFNNRLGHRCRRFSEVLKVHDTQQKLDGIACERTGGGWCKLGRNWTPVCGLGQESGGFTGMLEEMEDSVRGLFR